MGCHGPDDVGFLLSLFPVQVMAQQATAGRRYLRAFVSGFFVAVPVTVTVLDRITYVARVEGASMQVRRYNTSTDQSERRNLTLRPTGGEAAVSTPVALTTDDKEVTAP